MAVLVLILVVVDDGLVLDTREISQEAIRS